MALIHFFPHRCGSNYWDVWDWPQFLFNQNFGLDLDDFDDALISRRQQLAQRSGASQVTNDDNKFEVKLDCSHFNPEEITVKTINNSLVIHGKHEEKKDNHSYIKREFTRKYALPEGCQVEKVVSSLTSNGLLTIEAPKKPLEELKTEEKIIPIAVANEQQNAIKE